MMVTSNLQKKYWSNKTEENRQTYRKQKNYTSKLCKKEKRNFIRNLDFRDAKQNKKFWETVKPFVSDKGNGQENTTLIHDDNVISNDKEIATIFNNFLKLQWSNWVHLTTIMCSAMPVK